MLTNIGIDMAKASFDAAVWQNNQAEYLGHYSNCDAGFEQLSQDLVRYGSEIKLIMEPTGKYEMGLVFFAHRQGWSNSLINPKWVKDWAKGIGRRGKNDRRDAEMLAQYGAERNPPCYLIEEEDIQNLDDLLARQNDLQKMIRAEKNRLKQYRTRPRAMGRIIDSLEKNIAGLEEEMGLIEEEIQEVYQRNPDLNASKIQLLTVPGVGQKLVNHLIVLLNRWELQTGGEGNKKQLTAFVGLDPQPFQSGTSVFQRAIISKQGNPLMRQKLYISALGGVRGNNAIRDFYLRLVGRGKSKKLALVASARKILVWAWAVFTYKTPFDAAKAAPNLV